MWRILTGVSGGFELERVAEFTGNRHLTELAAEVGAMHVSIADAVQIA